jgi:1-acyl-sn-glycerol-3-phosphate acyltransferase
MRSLFYLFALLVLTLYYGLKVILAGLVFRVPNRPGGVYDEAARRWGTKQLTAAGVPVELVGWERVPDGQPVVFVSNHQSWFDILALISRIPHTVRFVYKKELGSVPILGGALKAAGHIILDRQNRSQAFGAYESAAAAIRAGMSAVVFAEGTRSRTGELLPFKKGPFVLALASGVPIIPVYCAGTFTIMPKGSVFIRPRPVRLIFGDPIPTAGLTYDDRQHVLQLTREVIEQFKRDATSFET